jgi:hypothetical protein
MSRNTYRLSFHVTHPSLTADAIRQEVKLPVAYAQSVGLPRATPRGNPLDGVYKVTNVHFAAHDKPLEFAQESFREVLKGVLSAMEPDFPQRVAESGGATHVLVGLFSDESLLLEVPPEVLHELATRKIGLKMDFYGGEE